MEFEKVLVTFPYPLFTKLQSIFDCPTTIFSSGITKTVFHTIFFSAVVSLF